MEFKSVEVTLREDVLKLYTLYLEKHETLTQGEREAYQAYLKMISEPGVEMP